MTEVLPIFQVLPELSKLLRQCSNLVLVAPPGSGKTTRVPPALLAEDWLGGRKIVMLEPRRLAARQAARYMASLLRESVGETIGYRVRMDACVSGKTRIEVVTEGILTRMLQHDPALESVGLLIFDEFHERSLHADLGLALSLQAQALLRPDLRLLVMSATLEAEPLAALLGNAPVVKAEGRCFPVETSYLRQNAGERPEILVARAVKEELAGGQSGDMLVFLPGAPEIGRVQRMLAEQGIGRQGKVLVAPLYGSLPQAAQDAALAPAPPGLRKIVLATSIAETSLTVEGVTTVIDSGLMRISRFSPRTGMTRLDTVRVSRAAADQRQGRAGRLAPGKCRRLWTLAEDARLLPQNAPEILEADLAPLALELAAWGIRSPQELAWLDMPPQAAFEQANSLLRQLGALDEDNRITAHGRAMAESGIHPRLAHMILAAGTPGMATLACRTAALLEERDLLRGEAAKDADLRLRLDLLDQFLAGQTVASEMRPLLYRIAEVTKRLGKIFAIKEKQSADSQACGALLSLAFPDRIAQNRGQGRFLLTSGRGAMLSGIQSLAEEPYLVATELEDAGADSRIYLAAPVSEVDLRAVGKNRIITEDSVAWDRTLQAVRGKTVERLGAVILKEGIREKFSPEQNLAALLQGIRAEGLVVLPWSKAASRLQERLLFMGHWEKGWPDVSEASLLDGLEQWLAPYLGGWKSRSDLQQLNLAAVFQAMLDWPQQKRLEEAAPTHIQVPSGQRIPVDYRNLEMPVLAVKLQELFGLTATPAVLCGKVPLTLHLLSPAQRPVQVTRDLANFWRTTYFEVKKDLMGRYPKHYWPDDPAAATPTHRVRPRA